MKPKSLTRFLLVEDEDAHAELVERGLAKARIHNELVRTRDGDEAIAYLARDPPHAGAPRPDVVLLDLMLPRVGGLDVLRHIRSTSELTQLPVVILTTSDSIRLRAEAQALHVSCILKKPVGLEKFRRMMRDLSLDSGVWNRQAVH